MSQSTAEAQAESLPVVPIYFSSSSVPNKSDLFGFLGTGLASVTGLCIFPSVSIEDLSNQIGCQRSGIAVCMIQDSDDLNKFIQILEDTDRLSILSGAVRFIFVYLNGKQFGDPLLSSSSESGVLQLGTPANSRVLTEVQSLIEPIRKAMRVILAPFGPMSLQVGDQIHKPQYRIDVTDPLFLALDDYWLIEEEKNIVRKANLWNIKAIGPGPRTGSWKKIARSGSDPIPITGQTCWQWVFYKHTEAIFTTGAQKWVFIGYEPTFVDERWEFSGISPALMLCDSESVLGWKLQCHGKDHLTVAANSEQALSYLPQMMDSIAEKISVSSIVLPMRTSESPRDTSKAQETERLLDPSKFTRIEDTLHIVESLNEGLRTIGSVYFWGKKFNARFKTHVTDIDSKNGTFTVRRPIANAANQEVDEILKTGKNQSFFFRCLFQRSHIFFVGKIKSHDESELCFEMPVKAFELQRRTAPRLKIPEHWEMTAAVGDGEYRVQNLSSTGLAFQIPKKNQSSFKNGMSIDVAFHVQRRRLVFKAEVRHIKDDRVGLKFSDVLARDSQYLSYFIYQKLLETL